jgi:hypothetical protein
VRELRDIDGLPSFVTYFATSARKLAKIHENTAVTLAKINGNEISIKKMAELHGIKILK